MLPTVLEPSDGAVVLQACPSFAQRAKKSAEAEVFEESIVVSRALIDRVSKLLEELVLQMHAAKYVHQLA